MIHNKLGNEQRSFCRFWDCIQVLHFRLFCWLRGLLHFFQGILAHSSRYNGHLSKFTHSTALSNSMKLWTMLCRATQDGQVMVEGSDKTLSTGEGNGKPLQYSCLRIPWTVWKGKKIGHWKMNSPSRKIPNMLLQKSGEITPERMKRWSQSKNNAQLWMWLVMEVKSDAIKNNIA